MKVRLVWKPGGLRDRHRNAEADAPPGGLVDVRSHILWGLGDGPPSLDQSITMLKLAAEHGTTDIVATPSASFECRFDSQIVDERLAEVRTRCDGFIRIHNGCDFHFSIGNIRDALANPQKYTINRMNFLLVEFSDVVIPPATEEILRKFLAKGITPVIGHPERNPILQRSTERLQAWISLGCVLQITARSLSGHFGKGEQRCAWDLLRQGMGYVIASDARGMIQNPARLDAAWRLVKHDLGEDIARKLLIDNPRAIIQGAALARKPAAAPIASARIAVRERSSRNLDDSAMIGFQ
jgi:protein-tyrosine phosphatase